MVKTIFFDALAKVMTRSSVQLSLYGPMRDNQDSSLQKVYQRNELQAQLEAHKASSSVFGDLQYKLAQLKTNNTEKQVQLVFTHHTKKRRQGRVDTVTTDFAQEKIPSITRQYEFVKYCVSARTIKRHHQLQRKHGNYESCTKLLVDKRIVSKFLPPNLIVQEQEEVPFIKAGINCAVRAVNVLLHWSYLYLVNLSTDMLVCFRKQLYIKFPQDYAVIRTSQGYQTGRIQVLEALHKYATCFDSTRARTVVFAQNSSARQIPKR